MKNKPYHTNSALQTWEEKNYMRLMSKKIQAAKSTVPKLPSSKKSFTSHNTGSVGRTASHQGHQLPASVEPEDASCANRVDDGGEEPVVCLQPSCTDSPLTAFVSPARHVSSCRNRYGATWFVQHPDQPGTPPLPPVPLAQPAVPLQSAAAQQATAVLTRTQAVPQPAAALPQLQSAPAQQATAVATATQAFPKPAAALPLHPSKPPPNPTLGQSGTPTGLYPAMHDAKGFGLPPIPGHSAQPSWSPKTGQEAVLTKAKAALPGKKDAAFRPGKQKVRMQATGKASRDRASRAPGWNSDFSIQYQEPLSIKDQERALRHAAQARTKQPPAPAVGKERRSGAAERIAPAEPQGSWPVLSNFTQKATGLQNSRARQLAPAVGNDIAAAANVQRVGGAEKGSAPIEPREQEQLKGAGCASKLRGGSIAYSRNLDSAQSPLRPAKGFVIDDDQTELCKLNKFCFLPFQESANGESQTSVSSKASIPPLLNAMVHSQQSPEVQPFHTSGASFLMHSSSLTPLKDSQLASSSPSHPLFMHTSRQQSPCTSQQSPASLPQSPCTSQQSPASLQHCRISMQRSPVRSWKSLRPESRATLDGSSELLTGLQGISPATKASNSLLQSHALTASYKKPATAAQHSQGRAGSLGGSLQQAPLVSRLPVQNVQPSSHQGSRLGPDEAELLHTAATLDSSLQPASKQGSAINDCSHAHHSSANRSTSLAATVSASLHATVSTLNGSCYSHGRCSPGHASGSRTFVADSSTDAGGSPPNNSSMQAAHVPGAPAGPGRCTVSPSSSATNSVADCSSTVSRASFPFLIGWQHARAGAGPTADRQSSACTQLELLSALNSADLAYIGRETAAPLLDVVSLSGSSSVASTEDSSSGKQAAANTADACVAVQNAASLAGFGNAGATSSYNGQVLSRGRSDTARNAMSSCGAIGIHEELGDDDVVLSGGDSEVGLLGDHRNSSVAAADTVSETSMNAHHGHIFPEAKPAENVDDELHSSQSRLEHGNTLGLPALHASCDSLYDDDDWEG